MLETDGGEGFACGTQGGSTEKPARSQTSKSKNSSTATVDDRYGTYNAVSQRTSPAIFISAPTKLAGPSGDSDGASFTVSEADVLSTMARAISEVPPPVDFSVPEELIPRRHLEKVPYTLNPKP